MLVFIFLFGLFVCFVRKFAFDDCKWLYKDHEKFENNSRINLVIMYIPTYNYIQYTLVMFIYSVPCLQKFPRGQHTIDKYLKKFLE